MPSVISKVRALASIAVIIGAYVCAPCYAQSTSQNSTCAPVTPSPTALLNEVHTIATDSRAVPLECSFNVSVAGSYRVTLADLGVVPGSSPSAPAPLASVKLAVTSGSTIVGTPLSAAGSMQFTAAVGSYVIRVVGLPGTLPGSGPIGIQVTNVSDSSVLASFSQNLALPNSTVPSNEALLDSTFTVASDGNYVVTLADLQVPQALSVLELIVLTDTGTVVTNPPLTGASTATVALLHGVNYRIFGVGQADPAVNAGLFSATVSPAGGGAPVFNRIIPVGTTAPIGSVALAAGTSYTFQLSDLAFPAALSSVVGAVVADGQLVVQLNNAGTSTPFTSAATTYQVFANAVGAPQGSYTATLAPASGAPALSVARAVSASGSGAAYSFDTTVATAGTYTFNLVDFTAPVKFVSITAAAVQAGSLLRTPLLATGSQNVTAVAGTITFLVFAQADPSGGLFGLDFTASGASTSAYEITQGVGQLFSRRQISFTAAGDYALTVTDVGFPAQLASFAVYLTQGTSRLGSVYTSGPLTFSVTPGNYYVNFIAQAGGADMAGTYAIAIALAPTVTFTSDNATVSSGGTVTLKWSSSNADTCTASGGWTGQQLLTGTATSSALTAATTFTLTCTGGGVTVAKSVTVSVTDPPAKSGGGGSLSDDILLALAMLVAIRAWRQRWI